MARHHPLNPSPTSPLRGTPKNKFHSALDTHTGLRYQSRMKRKVKQWRQRWKLTQQQAAAAVGVPIRTWQDWEQGRHTPRGLALEALTTKLQNPPEE